MRHPIVNLQQQRLSFFSKQHPSLHSHPMTMRALLAIGVILIVLGIVSLFVGIPHHETSGIKVGGAEIGVQTKTSERIPLPASIAIIAGGVVLAAVGGRSSR